MSAELTPLERFLANPDDLPTFGFDTYQVAIMVGYLEKGTPRGSSEARKAADRVRVTLIKRGFLAAVLVGTEYRVFTPALIEFMTPERRAS